MTISFQNQRKMCVFFIADSCELRDLKFFEKKNLYVLSYTLADVPSDGRGCIKMGKDGRECPRWYIFQRECPRW